MARFNFFPQSDDGQEVIFLETLEGHSSTRFYSATPDDHEELVRLWEGSVRATHDFVSSNDVSVFRDIVINEMLPKIDVAYMRDDEGDISGFAGVIGDKIEMLFVAPKYIGKGIGKRLFWHAVCEMNATKLDVNESNVKAVNFYMRQGCKVVGRSPLDSTGKPYPILHLEWTHTQNP